MNREENDEKINLHEGHRARMREQFRKNGLESFNEHQIVEVLLYYGYPRRDTNEMAHELVNRFGSLAGIMDADLDELVTSGGLCENAAMLFKIIPKCLSAYYNSKCDGKVYDNVDKLKELFRPFFVGLNHEEFRMACFDNDLRIVSNWLVTTGGPSSASSEMRIIVEKALRTKASYVVIAHNHPAGSPVPSDEDTCSTRMINSTLKSLGIILLDHIIVGKTSAASMRELACINVFD